MSDIENNLKKFKAAFLICTSLNILIPSLTLAMYDEGYLAPFPTTHPRYNNISEDLPYPLIREKSPPESLLESALQGLKTLKKISEFDSNILDNSSPTVSFKAINKQDALFLLPFYSEKPEEREHAYQRDIKERLLHVLKDTAEASFEFPQTPLILLRPEILGLAPEFQDIAIRDIFKDQTHGLGALKKAILDLSETSRLTKQQREPLRLYKNLAGLFYDYKALEILLEESPFQNSELDPSKPEDRIGIIRRFQVQGEFLKHMLPWTLSFVSDFPSVELLGELRDCLAHLNIRKVKYLLSDKKEVEELFSGLIDEQKNLYQQFQAIYAAHPLKSMPQGALQLRSTKKRAEQEAKKTWESLKQDFVSDFTPNKWMPLRKLLRGLNPLNSSAAQRNNNTSSGQQLTAISAILSPLYPPKAEELRTHSEPNHSARKWWDIIKNNRTKNDEEFIKTLKEKGPMAPQSLPQELAIEHYYQTLQSKIQEVKKAYECKQEKEGKSLKKEQEKIQTRIILLLMGHTEQEAEEFEKLDGKSKADHPDFKKWKNIIQGSRTKPLKEFIQLLRDKASPKQELLLSDQEIITIYKTLRAKEQEIKKAYEAQPDNVDETLKEQQEEIQSIFVYTLMGYTEEEAKQTRKTRQRTNQLDELRKALDDYQKDAKLYRGHGNISEKYVNFITEISPAIEALDDDLISSLGLTDELKSYDWENPPSHLEQLFHHILHIPIQSEEEKRTHRLVKVNEMLETLYFIREITGIKTTIEFENYKNWFQQFIQGKASLLRKILNELNMAAVDEAINAFSKSLQHSPFNAMLVTKNSLGDIGHQKIESFINSIERAVANLPKKYFRKDGFLTLTKEARELIQTFNSDRLKKAWSGKEAKSAYEALIIKLREFTEKFKNMKISDLVSKKQEKIYFMANNIPNISSREEGDKIYKEFFARAKKALKELEKLPSESFYDNGAEVLSLEKLREEKEETLKELRNQLFDETRSSKKKELMLFAEQQRVLDNPRSLPSHLTVVEQKIKNSQGEDRSKKAVYEFLITTFYEQLKDVSDYPELSSLSSFKQVRNYYSHPKPYREPLIIDDGKHFEGGIYLDNPEGTVAQELVRLGLNVYMILEESSKKLAAHGDEHSTKYCRKLGKQSSDNLQKSKKGIAGSPTGKDLTKGRSRNDSTEEEKKEKALGSNASNANLPSDKDHLTENDYNNLNIQIKADANGISIRNAPLNTVGKTQKTYRIDGKTFYLQNVSGKSMRCFFNAVGLKADIEIEKLRSKDNDPIVRYMVANEIVSAAANPDQLPKQVKDTISYTLYEAQRDTLDHLEETRSEKLAAQNPDGNLQDLQALPMGLQKVGKKGDAILEELRKRAFSLKAFSAFLDYHIGSENMMVALHGVQGEAQDNKNADYTSIDAIAYINNLGIKIYQPNGKKGLHLTHQFIPHGTTEVVYLYHQGLHFQALVPE